MTPRDPQEHPRAATPLELLFDLCFVVAIAQLAAALHHAIAADHAMEGVGGFVMVFLAIWWAWMGFTWFASAFDTDDAPYRLKVLVQMAGVLVLASGVERAFEEGDYTVMTLGYVIMRIGLVALWVRAGKSHASVRATAYRYAVGIVVLQAFWIGLLGVPANLWLYGWAVLIVGELLVPLWAESAANTSWHPHHISERYGLLTIIVIGESVLASTLAIESAIDLGTMPGSLVQVIVSAPGILFAMWWLYFSQPGHAALGTMRRAFVWGYGHYFVFASAAAVGAALAVAVDHATSRTEISDLQAALALAIPVAIYLFSVWFVQIRPQPNDEICGKIFLLSILAVLATPWTPIPTTAIAAILAVTTGLVVWSVDRRSAEPATTH
jgi:low temperature requirement protein LtrA